MTFLAAWVTQRKLMTKKRGKRLWRQIIGVSEHKRSFTWTEMAWLLALGAQEQSWIGSFPMCFISPIYIHTHMSGGEYWVMTVHSSVFLIYCISSFIQLINELPPLLENSSLDSLYPFHYKPKKGSFSSHPWYFNINLPELHKLQFSQVNRRNCLGIACG